MNFRKKLKRKFGRTKHRCNKHVRIDVMEVRVGVAQSVRPRATGLTTRLRFPFFTMSRQVVRPTQPLIQRIPGTILVGAKRPGHKAYQSSPSRDEVKKYYILASCCTVLFNNFWG
jgi:hypothetical protein